MTNYAAIAAWASVAGAVGQVVTALAVLAYTAKTSRATARKNFDDMMNNWNTMVASSPAHIAALQTLRKPVKGHPIDSIIFSYLNCMRAFIDLRNERFVSSESEEAHLKNAMNWLKDLNRADLETYLSRGYDKEFRARILAAFDSTPR